MAQNEKWELFRVIHRVRPMPQHPKYFEIQYGFLIVVLYAESESDAAKRSADIVELLPYERASGEVIVQSGTHSDRALDVVIQEAKEVGLGIFLHACETGIEEFEGFTDSPLD